jgi:hypothetical protein
MRSFPVKGVSDAYHASLEGIFLWIAGWWKTRTAEGGCPHMAGFMAGFVSVFFHLY